MTLSRPTWSLRLFIVSLAAVAISLPIAWVSIAKLLLVMAFLFEVARRAWTKEASPEWKSLQVSRLIPWLITFTFVSLLWTQADLDTALQSVVKHSKLIFILIPVLLVRSLPEAQIAMRAFAIGQLIMLLSSWMVFAGIALPWVIYNGGKNAVFSSYLDQSMILASSAAIFWHLRASGIWPRWLALVCTVAAAANVLLLLEGRTGYVLVIGLTGLALAWACPPRWRKVLFGLTAALVMASVALAYLLAQHKPDANNPGSRVYVQSGRTLGSDDWRLNAWYRSLQAAKQAPLVGTGAGSWKSAIAPFDGATFIENFGTSPISNPHQQYLLWVVEFGVLGCAGLLIGLLLAARDARQFAPPVARALWSVLAACTVAGLFNSVLYDDSIGDFFCIAAGLLLALGLHSNTSEAKTL